VNTPSPIRLITLGATSALQTQAIYHAVAERMTPDASDTIILCRTATPYLCLGYHQGFDDVLDRSACERLSLPVFRRKVGGGTTYLDSDQLFYQFILHKNRVPAMFNDVFAQTLAAPVSALRRLDVDAVLRHVNEIEVGGKRIAGTGGGWICDAAVVVGNVLFDFRYDVLVDVWRFPSESSRSLADYALRQRVTTLKKKAPWVKPADMERVLIEELPRVFGRDVMPDHLTEEELRHSHTVGAKLSSSDYLNLHADTTRAPRPLKIAAETFIHSERIELGARKVGISMLVHQGIIQEVRLDTSEYGESSRMEDELDGVPFEGWRERVEFCEKEVA
jgi:lipoate-protein ligase A